MARTTSDLISELRSESHKFTSLQLVVGFQSSTRFINAEDPDALTKLDEAIRDGGEPVGMIGWNHEPGILRIFTRRFEEYREEQWALDYLDAIADGKARAVGALPFSPGAWPIN